MPFLTAFDHLTLELLLHSRCPTITFSLLIIVFIGASLLKMPVLINAFKQIVYFNETNLMSKVNSELAGIPGNA